MSWLRRPPYHISRWEYYVDPWWDALMVTLNPRLQSCCAARKPRHKMDCESGR
jgi:hypothetical protein